MDSPESRERKLIGEVTHYFGKIGVAVVNVKSPLRQGDQILIEGSTTNIRQRAQSLQYNRKSIQEARPGLSIGLKVSDRVRERDKVFVLRPGFKIVARPAVRSAKPKTRRAAKAIRRARPKLRPRLKLRTRPKLKARPAARARPRVKARRTLKVRARPARPKSRSVVRSSRPARKAARRRR